MDKQKTTAIETPPRSKSEERRLAIQNDERDYHFSPPDFEPMTIWAKDIHEATEKWEKVKKPLT